MRKWLIPCLSVVVLVSTGIAQVRADTIIDTTTSPPWNGVTNASSFGVSAVTTVSTTYGEALVVPSGNTLLVSFGFEMEVPTDLSFNGEVFAWDSTNNIATGTSLYQSAATSSSSGSSYQFINFTLPSGGLTVTAGQSYILMITASPEYSADLAENSGFGAGGGSVGSPNNPASTSGAGEYWHINDDGNEADWTNTSGNGSDGKLWTNQTNIGIDQLAFKADFSAGTGAVPLPAALPTGAMGLVMAGGLLCVRRLRTAA